MNLKATFILFILMQGYVFGQSLKHPVIWVTEEDKPKILENIAKYEWAKSIKKQLEERVEPFLKTHASNPQAIISLVPAFATHDKQNPEKQAGPVAAGHNKVLTLASDAAMLYYLTDNEQYAQFSADILGAYIDHIAPRTPETTTICGFEFFDPRTTYAVFAISYDFIYNFLQKPDSKVYSQAKQAYVKFDNQKAQKAIANIVGNVLQEYGEPDVHGKFISNHPVLTAPGALFGILCVEDDVERNRLFNVFWEKGTAHQNSFKNTILPMFGEQGIWPESTSYGFMPIITLTLNIVDRIFPEMNVIKDTRQILDGNFLFDYLRYPDRRFVKYGDSKRMSDGTTELYRYTFNIAQRKGLKDLEEQSIVALSQAYSAKGAYKPKLSDNIFNNFEMLELFWGIDIPKKESSVDFNKPTVIIKHAGVALQRNISSKNNIDYGLCGIIGGAHYVHSHLTGITMELYGAGYVMAPNAGLPPSVAERLIPLHEHYFRLYAGNNTVVVNGTSHGRDEGSWKGKANVWQNTTVNIASEPKHLEDPISPDFNFATQFLKDEINKADQQRTLGIIRTSEQSGYYFDMFRSKSLGENKFHDYIYHNIGDRTTLSANGNELSVKETDRYQNDIGDVVKSPGWRYFEETKVTDPTSTAVKMRFDIDFDNKYMHMFVPEGVPREYTKALSPPTREAKNGYVNKKTQVVVIRQEGEAWDQPFTAIFEPSTSKNSTIQQVEQIVDKGKVVGLIVTSKVADSVIKDHIICQDASDAVLENESLNLYFKGRYGIVRKVSSKGQTSISLYIGEGEKLTFQGNDLNVNGDKKGFKVLSQN